MKIPSYFVGRWLRTRQHPEFGLGYCRGVRGADVVLSFVDVPGVAESELTVATSDLVDASIPVGTRVWIRGTVYGWHAGVVERATTAQRYHVSLVGAAGRLLLHEDQFVIRWSRPLEDPVVAIAHGLTDAPIFYEARSAFFTEMVRQRQVSRGLSAAISAPIELFQHQIDTAARVLSDPVARYLLADEVGLGKTIEAGLVIRQLLIDDGATKVLVLCPESLIGQWVSELRNRLGLGEWVDEAGLRVASHADVRLVDDLRSYDLVVIDEAHNLLRFVEPGSEIERDLGSVERLLALSATPIRGARDAFWRLLVLVDPVAFGESTAEAFRVRLEERERSAGDVQLLLSRRASLRQKKAVLDSVLDDFGDDKNVRDIAVICRDSQDAQADEWTDLADYVREIYRLSRRMIRHRRSGEVTERYTVAGRFPTFVEVCDPARGVIDEFLELYRLQAKASDSSSFFVQAVVHALAGPLSFRDYLQRTLRASDEVSHSPLADQRSLFEMTIARLEAAGLDTRIDEAVGVVWDRARSERKVVVVSAFLSTARRFQASLRETLYEHNIYSHFDDITSEERDQSIANFLEDYPGAVLVADASMEEGRNLQEAEVLVNLDLPLDVNRLDQRIGRLDRYTVRSEPAEIVVLTEPDSEWVSAQVRLLHAGTGVFDMSVSTVQRLLASLLNSVIDSLPAKGVDALNLDAHVVRQNVDDERSSVDLLEEMESITSATVFGDAAFAELLEYEEDTEVLRSAMKRLTSGTGSLALRPIEAPGGVIRFTGARDIGLAEHEVPALERLLRPKSYDRSVALEQAGVAPFRIGDPFVNWLERYLLADERGRASALVRPLSGISSPALWLHSEFLIDFDLGKASALADPERRRLIRRGEGVLPPIRMETWTDPSGPAPEELIDDVLRLPFDGRRDEVLRGRIWAPVLAELPSWSQLCNASAAAAREVVAQSIEVADATRAAAAAAEEDTARRLAILEARSLRLPTQDEREGARQELERERATGDALAAGIKCPSIRMVACGVCVLWPEDTF
jgi:superfamily II DNA or RNA helicase